MSAAKGYVALLGALVAARRRQGMTQEQLANRLGVTRQTITQWEDCTTTPRLPHLFGWAKALGLTITAVAAED